MKKKQQNISLALKFVLAKINTVFVCKNKIDTIR